MTLEQGLEWRQVEADAGQVLMDLRDLDQQAALGGSDIGDRLMLGPGELCRKRLCDRQRCCGHGACECFERARISQSIGIQPGRLRSALGLAGLKRRCQAVPVPEKLQVEELEFTPKIARLAAIEEESGFCRISVMAAFIAIEEAESDQSVEEIAGSALIDAD